MQGCCPFPRVSWMHRQRHCPNTATGTDSSILTVSLSQTKWSSHHLSLYQTHLWQLKKQMGKFLAPLSKHSVPWSVVNFTSVEKRGKRSGCRWKVCASDWALLWGLGTLFCCFYLFLSFLSEILELRLPGLREGIFLSWLCLWVCLSVFWAKLCLLQP